MNTSKTIQKKKSLKSALLILPLLIASCSTINYNIPDVELCVDLGNVRDAECNTLMSQKQTTVDVREWDEKRIGRISMPSSHWVDLLSEIESVCAHKHVSCKKKEIRAIRSMNRFIRSAYNK